MTANGLAQARRGAQVLYRLGARRVWICGSIARAGRWDERSDVDYAVEGLPAHCLTDASSTLARFLARRVNVVPMEDAAPGLRASIVAGRILVDPDGRDHGSEHPVTPPTATAGPAVATGPWHERRLAAVAALLAEAGARRIVDFGCGSGRLLELLAASGAEQLTGIDRDADALRRTEARFAALPDADRQRVAFHHGSLSVWHDELAGHDGAVAVEVIEHLDPSDLDAFVQTAFGRLRPRVLVLTTPNAEFNALLKTVGLRHPEHRFEWTRAQFRAWTRPIASAYSYEVVIRPLGRSYPWYGAPTQLALFRHREPHAVG
jgi:SAM-dependent methyltransferase/predicted nucleotidyltransferase